jgi:hypothetical protein
MVCKKSQFNVLNRRVSRPTYIIHYSKKVRLKFLIRVLFRILFSRYEQIRVISANNLVSEIISQSVEQSFCLTDGANYPWLIKK